MLHRRWREFKRRENGHVTEVASLKEGEWSCYIGGLMEGVVKEWPRLRENGHVTEVASLKKGEWSCYGGHFNGKENAHVTEVVTLTEREWSCY